MADSHDVGHALPADDSNSSVPLADVTAPAHSAATSSSSSSHSSMPGDAGAERSAATEVDSQVGEPTAAPAASPSSNPSSASAAELHAASASSASAAPAVTQPADSIASPSGPPGAADAPASENTPAAAAVVAALASLPSDDASSAPVAAAPAPVAPVVAEDVRIDVPVAAVAAAEAQDEQKGPDEEAPVEVVVAAASDASPAPSASASAAASSPSHALSIEPVSPAGDGAVAPAWNVPAAVAAAPLSSPVHTFTIDNTHSNPAPSAAASGALVGSGRVVVIHTGSTGLTVRANTTANTTNTTLAHGATRASPLKKLPLEVVTLMLSYCDAATLVRFGRTSSAHNSLACKKPLWTALLAHPWAAYAHMGQPINGVKMDTHAKQYYAARRLFALEQRRRKIEDHARSLERVKENHRGWWCLFLTDISLAPCVSILSFLFLVFLVFQLQKGQELTYFTFWPLLAIAGLFTVVATVLCCMKHVDPRPARGANGRRRHLLRLPDSFYSDSSSLVKDMMEAIGDGESRLAHGSFCFMLLVFAVFLVVLTLKLTHHITWSWFMVFIPLYIVFGLWCCAPCFEWPEEGHIKVMPCIAAWCALGIPLLAFVLLLNFKLWDSSVYGYSIVLIPLFVIDGLLLGLGIYVSKDDESPAGILAWLAGDGPLVVFKILLCYAADKPLAHLSPAVLFIPLYLIQAFMLCGCVAITVATADDNNMDYEDSPDPVNVPVPPV